LFYNCIDWRCSLRAECLPSMHKALGSIPTATKKWCSCLISVTLLLWEDFSD
jgi:hypothetical protein